VGGFSRDFIFKFKVHGFIEAAMALVDFASNQFAVTFAVFFIF